MGNIISFFSVAVLMFWIQWLLKRHPEIEKNKKNDSPYTISSSVLFFMTFLVSISLACLNDSLHIHGLNQVVFFSTIFVGLALIFWVRVARARSKPAIRDCTLSGSLLVTVVFLLELLSLELG